MEDLLARVREACTKEEWFETKLHPPHKQPRGIPTLESGSYRAATPMLRARFDFADRWDGAPFGLVWLGIEDMEDLWDPEHEWRPAIETRREVYRDSAIGTRPYSELTLFGIYYEDAAEVYLVWGDAGAEPSVLAYHGNTEYEFANLQAYIEWLLQA